MGSLTTVVSQYINSWQLNDKTHSDIVSVVSFSIYANIEFEAQPLQIANQNITYIGGGTDFEVCFKTGNEIYPESATAFTLPYYFSFPMTKYMVHKIFAVTLVKIMQYIASKALWLGLGAKTVT